MLIKKFIMPLLALSLSIGLIGCLKSQKIVEGIWKEDKSNIESTVNIRTRGSSLGEKLKYADDIIKFEVLEVIHISYIYDHKDLATYETRYGILYRVRVISSLINADIEVNTEKLIFSENSYKKYEYGSVSLQPSNIYIAALGNGRGILGEVLENYTDYYFKSQEFFVFPCKSDNRYLIQAQYKEEINLPSEPFDMGNIPDSDTDGYFDYEILPQEACNWVCITSDKFEERLTELSQEYK